MSKTRSDEHIQQAVSGYWPPSEATPETRRFLLGFLIHDVSNLRKRHLDHDLKELGLVRSRWWVLGNLYVRGRENLTQSEFASLLDTNKAALGVVLHQLELRGLIERVAREGDRRAKVLRLTKTGQVLCARMQQIVAASTPRLTQGITDEDIAVTERVLRRLRQNLEAESRED